MQIHELPRLSTSGSSLEDNDFLVCAKNNITYKFNFSVIKGITNSLITAGISAAINAGGAIYNAIVAGISAALGAGGAIKDAIDSAISTAQDDSFIMKNYTASYTCAPGNAVGVTANDFGFETPSGYTPIAVYNLQTRSNYIVFRSLNVGATGSTNALILVNISASQTATTTADIGVLYAKTAML